MKRIDIPIKQINNDSVSISTEKTDEINDIYKYYEGITVQSLLYNYHHKIPFTKNDLIYLYDIYNIKSEIYRNDSLVKIRSERNKFNDMAFIFDCSVSEIAGSEAELKKEPDKYLVLLDSLYIMDSNNANSYYKYPHLKYIRGNCEGTFFAHTNKRFPRLESIGGNAIFNSLIDSYGLENLKSIGRNATFYNLRDARTLKKLQYIGGFAKFPNLCYAKGLENLRYIGSYADFPKLPHINVLPSLEFIGNLEKSSFYVESPNDIEKLKKRVLKK